MGLATKCREKPTTEEIDQAEDEEGWVNQPLLNNHQSPGEAFQDNTLKNFSSCSKLTAN